ncbi:hypothetical protein F1654_05370 [Alkalicaulis satelles]|uniref:YceI family protein n=1 Tax=Alkalicaulis satelles TaxID=2609175 RepID=A0A5M6ZKR2_9PROT|nr:hypothetical protein [Alkalicaulis satelles]KAA5805409.1 hypothetical protein F1654_05370 [Alkalicaulis satelles]
MSMPAALPRHKTLLLAALPGLALAAAPALADDVSGSLDGEPRQWHVLQGEDSKTVNFRQDSPGFYSVTVQAHRNPRYEVEGSVSITFSLMGEEVLDATAMYFPEARMTPHFTDESALEGLVLERVELDGGQPRITGRYEGVLGYRASMFREPDPANTVSLVVEFDVTPSRED